MSDIVTSDGTKRSNRLAEIQDGLRGSNSWYWRDMAETRLRCLQEDEPIFGLVAHERDEMRALTRILAQQESTHDQ